MALFKEGTIVKMNNGWNQYRMILDIYDGGEVYGELYTLLDFSDGMIYENATRTIDSSYVEV